MADINIQRKKSSPSPWLLILLALLVLGAIAWFLLRKDASEQTPGAPPETTASTTSAVDPAAGLSAADSMMLEAPTATPEALAAATQRDPANPDYARNGLRILSGVLVDLADRADLRDADVSEKRDVLTSATARLDDSTASLRPGFVAATGLMQAMQQKAYPALEPAVGDLLDRAAQLSGRSSTPEDQQQLREFFSRATDVVRTLNEPSK
ncbi:hypothetical protein [Hymenobacter sp. YC55]|uniref:hypothetical protein n=1 Tax=Hymenobacter sp. YC55 TaxID=3034019 RepID=UPI0023F9CEFC|nr:hypothetical protein [Hymenobacter sp. YC55]MDF7814605.1 hypothetical protein [Hymenobacter sp. YC55]